MKPSVSIVVPVFNVEEYLRKCLDSLTAQTLREIEIIVVDDGSTDDSFRVASECAERDDRIRVIRQENRGVSGARNAGLDAASGEYIGFADPDDWAEPGMFEALYKKAKKDGADFCACDYRLVYEDRSVSNVLELRESSMSIAEYGLDRMWNEKKFAAVIWNKVFRRAIIEEHGLRFESTRNVFSEDVLFNLFFLRHADKASSVEGSYYNYFQQRPGSLMNSIKPDHLKRELFLVDRFAEYYATYPDADIRDRMMLRLFFERVQNSCMYNLERRGRVGNTWKELGEARRHELFGRSMRTAASEKEIWLPMRIFARLSGQGLLLPAACYMHAFGAASRVKKSLKAKKTFKPSETPPVQTT
ncbi:glycosyltransferase [Saccharibacillus alkalitolerans]|uniref:Glycosyltransferase n=1 Tax=Saccharibacillus alkalitolerans TaxID=2705290 RepID=A0ABX0F255_9BACL|nr:glycosyltransferase [Saccharibacillus alkalitolerans]NGZ74029.1 glycosyltransferase [Saccharibacillus alkalitolerans]